jgi:hypothetical protein
MGVPFGDRGARFHENFDYMWRMDVNIMSALAVGRK